MKIGLAKFEDSSMRGSDDGRVTFEERSNGNEACF